MSPPAALVIGSVVVVAGVTIAFHQFVYEPHIAPKIEVFIENWLQKRRLRRLQLAPPVEAANNGRQPVANSNSSTPDATEMNIFPRMVRATGVENHATDSLNGRRRQPSGTHEPSMLESPNSFIPFSSLVPAPGIPQRKEAAIYSITSTPSTFSSSVLDLQSPSSRHESPTAVDDGHSHPNSLADSVLADDPLVSPPSPTRSITHISPRGLLVALLSPRDDTNSPDSDQVDGLSRRRDTVTQRQPTLVIPSNNNQTLTSPMSSSVFQSAMADTPLSPIFPAIVYQPSSPTAEESTSGYSTPRSHESWSDLASANDNDTQFLIGSDVESWANVSDRSD